MTPKPTSAVAARELAWKLQLIAAWHTPGGPTPRENCPVKHEVCNEAAVVLAALSTQPAAPAVLAEPVAWIVYLPSMQTQEIFDSQEDSGYVDWLTNYPDAEVTPLYDHPASQARSPLTEPQIDRIVAVTEVFQYQPGAILEFVREVERAHGIGSATTGAKSHE